MDEDLNQLKLIKQGSEAKIYVCTYLGRPTLVKERFPKKYRHPDLDTEITKDRLKNEARSIVRCSTGDVKTPTLYLVDLVRRRIYMEYFEKNLTVKEYLKKLTVYGDCEEQIKLLAKMVGECIQKMHDKSIIHGDLTTSNILVVPKNDNDEVNWREIEKLEVVMIDFGLSYNVTKAEDRAVDLYVLERAVASTSVGEFDFFKGVLEAYVNFSTNKTADFMKKYNEVSARGRKRSMVG